MIFALCLGNFGDARWRRKVCLQLFKEMLSVSSVYKCFALLIFFQIRCTWLSQLFHSTVHALSSHFRWFIHPSSTSSSCWFIQTALVILIIAVLLQCCVHASALGYSSHVIANLCLNSGNRVIYVMIHPNSLMIDPNSLLWSNAISLFPLGRFSCQARRSKPPSQ